MPTSIAIAIAIVTLVWLTGIAACVVALRWSRPCRGRRFTGALLLGAGALAIGYLGFTRFELNYTRTVNGQRWSVSSKWFFLALILLAAVSPGATGSARVGGGEEKKRLGGRAFAEGKRVGGGFAPVRGLSCAADHRGSRFLTIPGI